MWKQSKMETNAQTQMNQNDGSSDEIEKNLVDAIASKEKVNQSIQL